MADTKSARPASEIFEANTCLPWPSERKKTAKNGCNQNRPAEVCLFTEEVTRLQSKALLEEQIKRLRRQAVMALRQQTLMAERKLEHQDEALLLPMRDHERACTWFM